jgi:glutamyl/glutaminyl-tRNA synthetase
LDKEKIVWKAQSQEEAKENLKKVLEIIVTETTSSISDEIMKLAEETGKGEVLWPLRYALSGREKSPDPFTLIDILGIKESKERIDKAIEILNKN